MKPTITILLKDYNNLLEIEKNYHDCREKVIFLRSSYSMNGINFNENVQFLMSSDCLKLSHKINKSLIRDLKYANNNIYRLKQDILSLQDDLDLEKKKSLFDRVCEKFMKNK